MKHSIKEILVRIIILFVGLTIAHLGVTLFLLVEVGADPFNVLVQGIFRTTQKIAWWPIPTHGVTHIAMCLLIIIVLLFVDRSYIKIGTILCMICGGPIIDFFTKYLEGPLSVVDAIWEKVLITILGCTILAFGMTIVMKSDAGTGPNDLVSIVTADKIKKNFGVVRIVCDFLFVAIGFALGGIVNYGTLICVFVVGSVANIFLPFNEKWINKVIGGVTK